MSDYLFMLFCGLNAYIVAICPFQDMVATYVFFTFLMLFIKYEAVEIIKNASTYITQILNCMCFQGSNELIHD